MKKHIFFLVFILSVTSGYAQTRASYRMIANFVQFEKDTREYRYAFQDSVEARDDKDDVTIAIDSIRCRASQDCVTGEKYLNNFIAKFMKKKPLNASKIKDLHEYLRVRYFRSKIFSLDQGEEGGEGMYSYKQVYYEFTEEGLTLTVAYDTVKFRKDDRYLFRVIDFFKKQHELEFKR